MNTKKFFTYLFLALGIILAANITYIVGYFRQMMKKQNELIVVLGNNREAPPAPAYPGNIIVMKNSKAS
jgi:hypothetical protein